MPVSPVRAADVTIDSAVGGPQLGQGGTFTVTSTGTISSGGEGIVATSGNAITALTIDGQVFAYSNGVNNGADSTISSIGVQGMVDGQENVGVLNSGTVGSLTTSVAGRISGLAGTGLRNEGTFTGTIFNAGTMEGFGAALDNSSTGQIFAFTNSGLVHADAAVKTTGTITTLTNEAGGHLQGGGWGVFVEDGGVGTILNSGSITGSSAVIVNGGITTLTNSGTLAGGSQGIGLGAAASVGSIANSGLVSGGADWGMGAEAGSTIGTLTNSGTFTGSNGISSSAVTGTIRNLAGGLIEGTGYGGLRQYATLTLLENAGSITGVNAVETGADIGTIENQAGGLISGVSRGLWLNSVAHTVTTLTNSGTITGCNGIESQGAIGTLRNEAGGAIFGDNSAVFLAGTVTRVENAGSIISSVNGIETSGDVGTIENQAGGLIDGTVRGVWLSSLSHAVTTLTNSGTIEGIIGIDNFGTITTLTNGGRIHGSGNAGISHASGLIGSLVNSGTIVGHSTGVRVEFGEITKITNTGTITSSVPGTGPALFVGMGGVLGDVTGAGGAAIVSTGGRIDGIIVNQGTIFHGFTIAYQDVTVSADGGVGMFTDGHLEVVDGDLSFSGDGMTMLQADVQVYGGNGTVFNEAVLGVIGGRSITGNFVQRSAGTTSSVITDASTYGSLAISGTAVFAGVLDLSGGAALEAGQTFNLFSFGTSAGAFSGLSVDGTALAPHGVNQWLYGGLVLSENWGASSMSVSIAPVPEPTTFALGAAGIACAAWLRRRRRVAARKAA